MRLSNKRTKRIDVPNDPDNGYIEIENLSMEHVARLDGKFMEVTDKEVRMKNYAERDGEFAKACLKDWGNLFDESGNPMKFTAFNIDKASAYVIQVGEEKLRFYEWVNKERQTFAEAVEAEEAEALKN